MLCSRKGIGLGMRNQTIKWVIVVACVIVCCVCLSLLRGGLDKTVTVQQEDILHDAFQNVEAQMQFTEVEAAAEPYQAALDGDRIYYLGDAAEGASAPVEGAALYALAYEDSSAEFEIIEGKQGEKSAKDALKLIKDGNREHVDRDTLLQWTWDDGEESDTRSFYGVNGVLGTEYQLPQEAKYFGLWNGKLYWFGTEAQKTILAVQNMEPGSVRNVIAEGVRMPETDLWINDGYLAYIEEKQNRIVQMLLEDQKETVKLAIAGFSPQSVQSNARYIVCADETGESLVYDVLAKETYGLGNADVMNGSVQLYLRWDQVWMIQDQKQVVIYDLTDKTKSTMQLPEAEYTGFDVDCDGKLLAYSSQGKKFVVAAYADAKTA